MPLISQLERVLTSSPTDDSRPPVFPSHETSQISAPSLPESILSLPGPLAAPNAAAASPTMSFVCLSADEISDQENGISPIMPMVDPPPEIVDALSPESVYHPDWNFADGSVAILVCPSFLRIILKLTYLS
jgi:hypothetical protein